jgi:hypothetical protein
LIAPKVGHLPHADGHLATAAIFKLERHVCVPKTSSRGSFWN